MFKDFIQLIKANKTFFIAYNLLLLVGLYPILAWDKLAIFLFINEHHHPFIDTFFAYLTHLGSGITYGLLLVLLFLFKVPYRKLFIGITSFGAMSLIVQFLKRVIFLHHLRPVKAIELAQEAVQLHIVDNVEVLTHLSFPSGHAATIFAASWFLYLIRFPQSNATIQLVTEEEVGMLQTQVNYSPGIPNRMDSPVFVTALLLSSIKINKGLILLLIAVLVAYSRIYLCQHFYIDVYIGALIGGWTTILMYAFLINRPMPAWLTSRPPFKL